MNDYDYNPESEYEFVPQEPRDNKTQNRLQNNINQQLTSNQSQKNTNYAQEAQVQEKVSKGNPLSYNQYEQSQTEQLQTEQSQTEQSQPEQSQPEQIQPEQPYVPYSSAQSGVFTQMPQQAPPIQPTPINQQPLQKNAPYYPQALQMQASQMQASQMHTQQTYAAQTQVPQTNTFQNYNSQYPAQVNGAYPQNLVWQQAKPVEQNASNAYTQPSLQNNPYQATALKPQKPKTSTGTKVFISILCGLLVVMVSLFAISMTKLLSKPNNPSKNSATTETENNNEGDYPFFEFFGDNSSYNGSEFKQDLILQADDGSTAKHTTDKEESKGLPDENAKDLKLNALPKDASSDKYETQSVYENVAQSTVGIVCYKDKITNEKSDMVSQGTGTIVSKDGYIITNAHVIGNSKSFVINIILNNSEEYQAKVVGYDTWTDLAVLKIDADNLTAVEFGDSSLIKVGQDVLAIGNPGGTSFQNTLTKGIVSATDREIIINKNVKYIQIDAAINPGNSGGPLCNIYGQVIGINSAKISSSLYEGMGFAIPSQTVIDIANDLIHYGYIKDRVRIGISGIATTEEEVYYYKGYPKGVIIQEVDSTGPLADSKLQKGDIITAIDGVEVTSFQDIYAILSEHKAGDKITLTISRPNQ